MSASGRNNPRFVVGQLSTCQEQAQTLAVPTPELTRAFLQRYREHLQEAPRAPVERMTRSLKRSHRGQNLATALAVLATRMTDVTPEAFYRRIAADLEVDTVGCDRDDSLGPRSCPSHSDSGNAMFFRFQLFWLAVRPSWASRSSWKQRNCSLSSFML